MIKRILALTIVLSILCTSFAFAEDRSTQELYELYMNDITDINRVYKYDLAAGKGTSEDGGEQLTYKNAVSAVLALELMSVQADGLFNEAGAVPLKDFARMVMKLAAGSTEAFQNNYDDYPDNRYTTFDEVAYHLVGVLGYDVYEVKYQGDNVRALIANEIDLFEGVDYSGAKNITRGELAQVLMNALQIDLLEQASFGENISYEKTEGNNLLYSRFDSVFVTGLVTAQYGININSTSVPEEGTIEIDGAAYYLDSVDITDMLGHTAFAVAKIDKAGKYRLVSIVVDEADESLTMDIADVDDIRNGTLYYKDASGKELAKKVSKLRRISVNGDTLATTDLSDVLFDYEGELRICVDIDTKEVFAYITCMDTFKVFGVSPEISERIIFDHGSKYEGNGYISFAGKKLYIIKNGKDAALADIGYGSIISVIENSDKSEMKLLVSDVVVGGEIESIDGDDYYIGGEAYKLSAAYDTFRKTDSSLPEIKLGLSGDFYLDYAGRIASFASDGASYKYGYLRGISTDGGALASKCMAKIYTQDNEWKIFDLADKLTLDGISGISAKDAVASIKNYGEGIDNLIRYKLGGGEKINFIDTVKMEDEELSDPDAMSHDASWTGAFNWTVASKTMQSIGQYVITSKTRMFNVPSDRDAEDEYSYAASPTFTENTNGDLRLYNLNEFFVPSTIIRITGASADYSANHAYMVVTRLSQGLNEDGEPTLMIEALDGQTAPLWETKKYIVSDSILEQARQLKPGDILQFAANSKTLTGFEITVPADKYAVDKEVVAGGSFVKGMGTVLAVDPEMGHVKVQTGENIMTVYTQSLGLYDSKEQKGYNISDGEIEVGDRMFFGGGYGYMRCLVVR